MSGGPSVRGERGIEKKEGSKWARWSNGVTIQCTQKEFVIAQTFPSFRRGIEKNMTCS